MNFIVLPMLVFVVVVLALLVLFWPIYMNLYLTKIFTASPHESDEQKLIPLDQYPPPPPPFFLLLI